MIRVIDTSAGSCTNRPLGGPCSGWHQVVDGFGDLLVLIDTEHILTLTTHKYRPMEQVRLYSPSYAYGHRGDERESTGVDRTI